MSYDRNRPVKYWSVIIREGWLVLKEGKEPYLPSRMGLIRRGKCYFFSPNEN